jgi:hypothetical protein
MNDLEDSSDLWVFIRNNRYGDNKSSSGTRKIPLRIVLLPEENKRIIDYYHRRKVLNTSTDNALLFSIATSIYTPHDGNILTRIVNHFCKELTGTNLTFHHLRHSALSNMHVVLEGNSSLVTLLTPYSEQEADSIRKTFISLNYEYSNRDMYWAIAGLAGQLTPEVTFMHYLHFVDKILGDQVRQNSSCYSKNNLMGLGGLSSNSITRFSQTNNLDINKIPISKAKLLIIGHLKERIHYLTDSKIKSKSDTEIIDTDSQRNSVTMQVCYAALKAIENGEAPEFVSKRLSIERCRLDSYITKAQKLGQLKTQRKKSRLFPKSRKATQVGIFLTPARPTSSAELRECDKFIIKLRELFHEAPEDIKWSVSYFISHTNTSKAGISFTRFTDFERFMSVMTKIFSNKRWRLYLRLPDVDSIVRIEISNKWKEIGNGIAIKVSNKNIKWVNKYPQGEVKLYLKHPSEKDILSKDSWSQSEKYSSSTLRYVFHMLAIML